MAKAQRKLQEMKCHVDPGIQMGVWKLAAVGTLEGLQDGLGCNQMDILKKHVFLCI